MQSRQMRRNRKRWERKTGRFLLLASRFSLLLIMTGLLLFHGGRDAEGWGLAGMLLSLTLVCWAAGCLFSGKVALMPTQGPLVFGLVLGMGLLQLSPFIGGLWAPEGIKGFWAALQIAELPSGSPLLALLPGFHSQALLLCCRRRCSSFAGPALWRTVRHPLVILCRSLLCGLDEPSRAGAAFRRA